MAKCIRCGNTAHFNMWCSIQKVLEVKVNEKEELIEICGEPEDASLRVFEDIELMEGDLAFAMVSCAWCGSKEITVNGSRISLSPHILQ
jgi:hypothetical protein